MAKSSARVQKTSDSKTFFCKNRQAEVTTLFCLDSYVDVNALNIKDSQCFKCPQGNRIRCSFAGV